MWQKGNHGDTTLNKHYIPTGTERKREREGEGERRMRKMLFCEIYCDGCNVQIADRSENTVQIFKGSPH